MHGPAIVIKTLPLRPRQPVIFETLPGGGGRGAHAPSVSGDQAPPSGATPLATSARASCASKQARTARAVANRGVVDQRCSIKSVSYFAPDWQSRPDGVCHPVTIYTAKVEKQMTRGLFGPLETVDPHDPLGPLNGSELSIQRLSTSPTVPRSSRGPIVSG